MSSSVTRSQKRRVRPKWFEPEQNPASKKKKVTIHPVTQKLNVINVLPIDAGTSGTERKQASLPEELPVVIYKIFLAMCQRPHDNLYEDMLQELNSIYPDQVTTIRILLPSFLRLFDLLGSSTQHKKTKRKLEKQQRNRRGRHGRGHKRARHVFAAGGAPCRPDDVDSELSDDACDVVRTSSCWRFCSKVLKLCKR